jgi:hypothetical protein
MQDDPSAPSAPPSKGFASLMSLVSDVSKDLEALEQAAAEPPPPQVHAQPEPVRLPPEPAAPSPFVAPEVSPATPSGRATWADISRRLGSAAPPVAPRTEAPNWAHPPPRPVGVPPSKGTPLWVYLLLAALITLPCWVTMVFR